MIWFVSWLSCRRLFFLIHFYLRYVLTYSPTEAVTEVGKSKKKRSVIMPDDVPNNAMSDVVPLMDVTSKKGKSTLVKKIKELKLKKKLQKRKNSGKKKTTMMLKVSPIQGKPKRTLIKKTREGLFLSKRTTLNSLISKINFEKVPLT